MIDRKDWPEDARNAQAAFDEASWDAVEGYRDTGEMVPGMVRQAKLGRTNRMKGICTAKKTTCR